MDLDPTAHHDPTPHLRHSGEEQVAKRRRSARVVPDTDHVAATAAAQTQCVVATASLPARMELCLDTAQECQGPRHKHGQRYSTRGKFSQGLGEEFAKHKAYREANNMVAEGRWTYSEALRKNTLPTMPDRMLDLLHIIWLFFEQRGIDPMHVRQIWHLDQSLIRGQWKEDSLHQRRPSIPGLSINGQGGIVATVLPGSWMWVNTHLCFLTGIDMLQLQGVPIPYYPFLHQERDKLCKKLAGNMFSVPSVACLCLAAIVRRAHRAAGAEKGNTVVATAVAATAVVIATSMFSLEALAENMVKRLFSMWPDCFTGVPPFTLSVGTLCSGLDIVKPLLVALVQALKQQYGDLGINVLFKFGCESDPEVRRVRGKVADDTCYEDVYRLPPDIDTVCMIVAGFSCKSVSSQNNKPRSILRVDGDDPLCSSGNTFNAILEYVAAKQPELVILENVMGLLRKIPLSECDGDERPRNIDIVIKKLASCGYHVGHTLVNSYPVLPHRRVRVYIWAERKAPTITDKYVNAIWQELMGLVKPNLHVPLDTCLRHM